MKYYVNRRLKYIDSKGYEQLVPAIDAKGNKSVVEMTKEQAAHFVEAGVLEPKESKKESVKTEQKPKSKRAK